MKFAATPTPFLRVAALLVFLTAALPVTAQQEPAGHPAWQRVESLRSELAALPKVDAAAVDEDAVAALERRLRLERELREELGKLVDAAAAGNVDQAALIAALKDQAALMRREIDALGKRIDTLRAERDGAAPEAMLDYEYRLRDMHATLSGLLEDLLDNAARLTRLGAESSTREAALDELLKSRAASLSGRLELAAERVSVMRTRRKAANDEQKAALDVQLTALEERQDRLKESLAVVVDLMDQRGLDTAGLKELLFRASGEISGDLLNSDVLLGLAGAWLEEARTALIDNGPGWLFKLLVFVVLVLLARYAARLSAGVTRRAVSAPHLAFSQLLQDFFVKVASGLVLGIGLLIALSQIGIELAPLLAGLGVAGFIIGFALQDSLSNFASGLMILVYRPFDIGDVVEAGGVSGTVRHMSLVSTTIKTFDNQRLVVPNNRIWGDVIRNVNAEPTRRVDLSFGIGYGDDIDHAQRVLEEIVSSHELVLAEPAPSVKLHALGESSVDFLVRPWVKTPDYWTVYWDVTKAVKTRFDAEGISIPFPQRDVHLYRADDA